MDELEFRRKLYADPNDSSINDAIASDDERKRLAKQMKQIDADIAAAMKVSVPDKLAEKIILQQSLTAHQHRQRKTRWYLAMAASIAFIVGISFSYRYMTPAYNSISDYALAHYYHEQDDYKERAGSNYELDDINQVMGSMGISLQQSIGKLIAVEECFFDGMDSLHLVFEGLNDNVNVFILPKNKHLQHSKQFADNRTHGVSQQYPQGHVVIVADKNTPLDSWQQQLSRHIKWSI
ncbi:DUF3379 family protein [Thalassotalea maritima]|uniref:DUF3379 family protein n=1 Tax=Thalassotalea maritima TaxID=3242416 RepID=UPI0035293B99